MPGCNLKVINGRGKPKMNKVSAPAGECAKFTSESPNALELPDTQLVYVAAREGDIFGLMQRVHTLNHAADW